MDTLYSRVHGCNELDKNHPSGACILEGANELGGYFGADGGVYCRGQIIDKGDSLTYWFITKFLIRNPYVQYALGLC